MKDFFKKTKTFSFFVALLSVLLIAVLIASCSGHYSLKPLACIKILILGPFGYAGAWSALDQTVLLNIRMPRVVAAILVGAALSISGASYQSVFQNPLVSPDILGVSSGACVGAALAILMHLPRTYIMVFAFATGILTVAATLTIPKVLRSDSNMMLVLSGIIIGGLASSIIGIMKYVADPQSELPEITYWTMGSLDGISFREILIAVIPIVLCIVTLIKLSWWIDVISMGEKDAKTLGANVKKIRLITIACSTLLTATAVCLSGTIGWVGLVIPHFARMFVGTSNTRLIPTAALLGAIFLLAVDTIARTVASVEVPLGIITGIVGAPFYAWLLYRQRLNLN